MSEGTRRSYSQEFKVEAVRLIEEENYSLGQASSRLRVSKSVLAKWKSLYGHKRGLSGSSNQPAGLSFFEQKQMQKELERVRRERDILKKALAYFAVDPQK